MRGAYRRVGKPIQIHSTARGHAQCQLLNEDGSVAQEMSAPNLILNGGLDMVKVRPWVDNITHCVLGSNTAPTSTSSGSDLLDWAGTTVTLSKSYDTYNMAVGDTIVCVAGFGVTHRGRIVGFNSSVEVEVDFSVPMPINFTFTVYHTSQTVADMTEIQRTNNYVTAGGGCGTTITGNLVKHKRTFDFPVEAGSVTYREVAFSPSGTGADPIFSRIRLPSDLVVVANQRVRVIYTLEITVNPAIGVPGPADIIGWPVAPSDSTVGIQQVQLIGLRRVDPTTGGGLLDLTTGESLEPCHENGDCAVFLSNDGTAPAPFGSAVDRVGTGNFVADYTEIDPSSMTAGYGKLEKYVVIDVGDANRTDWRSIGIGSGTKSSPTKPYTMNSFVFVFTQNQTKDNLHTLEIRFLFIWDRVFA